MNEHYPVIDGMKVCNGCGKNKPESEYYKAPRGPGIRARCIDCLAKEASEKYKANPRKYLDIQMESRHRHIEKHRAKIRGYYWRHLKDQHERHRKYHMDHPECNRAHCAVRDALKSGVMVKPLKCAVCGNFDELEAHHWDYSKPLDVKWVCGICHAAIHKEKRQLTSGVICREIEHEL